MHVFARESRLGKKAMTRRRKGEGREGGGVMKENESRKRRAPRKGGKNEQILRVFEALARQVGAFSPSYHLSKHIFFMAPPHLARHSHG